MASSVVGKTDYTARTRERSGTSDDVTATASYNCNQSEVTSTSDVIEYLEIPSENIRDGKPEEVGCGVSQFASTCDEHENAELIYVCEDCYDTQPLVCRECVVSVHKGHKLDLLTTFAARKRKKMLKFVEDADVQYFKTSGDNIASIDVQIQQQEEHTKQLVNQIQRSSDDLKRDLEMDAGEKRSVCQLVGKKNSETLQQYRKDRLKSYNNIKSHLEECKIIVRQRNDVEIFLFAEGISQPEIANIPTLPKQAFHKCDNTRSTIAEMCGDLVIEDNQGEGCLTSDMQRDLNMSTDEELISSFDGDSHVLTAGENHPPQNNKKLAFICPEVPHMICATTSGQILVRSADNKSVICLNGKGGVVAILDCFIEITAMSFSSATDNIWVSGKDRSIREVVCPEPVLLRFFVECCATALCTTGDGKVLVGMPLMIQAYTTQGVPLHRSKTSGFFFTSPSTVAPVKIAECPITHSLAVISRKRQKSNEDTQIIVGLDAKLKPKFQHEIRDKRNSEQRFEPLDLCYNKGFVLVLTKCQKLYIISPNGDTGTFLKAFDDYPVSLSRVTNRVFVVGFQNKEAIFYQGKYNRDFIYS